MSYGSFHFFICYSLKWSFFNLSKQVASMEIVDGNAALLSNYEVYSLLTELQSKSSQQKKPSKTQQNLATISYETSKYLDNTPCKDQNAACIRKFMEEVHQFNITKAEKLQLLNNRPCTAVEIQLMIEESEERLTEEQIEQLLDIIGEVLPGGDTSEEEQGMETEEIPAGEGRDDTPGGDTFE